MKSNHLFPLRIRLDMKGKENSGATFKAEIKEVDKHCDKEEKRQKNTSNISIRGSR